MVIVETKEKTSDLNDISYLYCNNIIFFGYRVLSPIQPAPAALRSHEASRIAQPPPQLNAAALQIVL